MRPISMALSHIYTGYTRTMLMYLSAGSYIGNDVQFLDVV